MKFTVGILTALFSLLVSLNTYAQPPTKIAGIFELTTKVIVSWSQTIEVISKIKLSADKTITSLGKMAITPAHYDLGSSKPANGTWTQMASDQVRAITFQEAQGGKLCEQLDLQKCVIKIEADLVFISPNHVKLLGTRGMITVYDNTLKTYKTFPIIVGIEGTRI